MTIIATWRLGKFASPLNRYFSQITLTNRIYIHVLTVNIEFMWRGLENGVGVGGELLVASLSNRFVPSHINSIITVNTPILYLSCNKICKKKCYLRWSYTLQGDNSLKSVERFDHMIFVCRFQASRWSKPRKEKLLCG